MSRLGNVGARLYRGEISVNFVGRQRLWYTLSGLILLIAIVAVAVRGLNFSVDFKGGSVFTIPAPKASISQVEKAVADGGVSGNVVVQSVAKTGSREWQAQTPPLSAAQVARVQDSLSSELGVQKNAISTTFVGPTWGTEISHKAIEALIAFLVAVVIYLSLAFEWKMATAAFVALLHDIVITVGVYALAGFQVSPATIIGLLTILGYSLYDTVVVFDKVRENTAGLLGGARSTYSQAANLALNQTLVRSINTSVIALLPVTAILVAGSVLLGSGELSDLGLVLFVGMLSGTYSSICIATPVLAGLKEREPQYRALAKRVAVRASGGKAARKAAARTPQAAVATGGRGTAAGAAGPGGTQAPEMAVGTVDGRGDVPDGTQERDAGPGGAQGAAAGRAGVPAGYAASGSPRGGGRQQPRRPGSPRRRSSGKRKRR
ncbi:MAG TPA: protein translocase subunit SecF [Streptosporangiaceae bacterium]|nr:protein translocase subunit SecF [Streptosporangiaceae bacterium]